MNQLIRQTFDAFERELAQPCSDGPMVRVKSINIRRVDSSKLLFSASLQMSRLISEFPEESKY